MILKPPKGSLIRRPDPGLVGYWLMNEAGGGIVQDLSGNGLPLTHGATPPQWIGSALDYDTTAATSATRAGRVVGSTTGHISVLSWLKWQTLANGPFVSFNGQDRFTSGRMFHHDGRERWQWTIDGTTATSFGCSIVLDQWYLSTVTYDGENVRAYKNGQLDRTSSWPGSLDIGTERLYLGRWFQSGGIWDGQIKSLAVYNRALSAAEIRREYEDPYWRFRAEPIELWTAATGGGGEGGLPIPVAMHYNRMRRAS